MFAAVEFVLGGPFLRRQWMHRAFTVIDVNASDAHVAFAVAVVHARAFAAEFDGLVAAGWWCVTVHRSFKTAFTRSMKACLLS